MDDDILCFVIEQNKLIEHANTITERIPVDKISPKTSRRRRPTAKMSPVVSQSETSTVSNEALKSSSN